MTWISNGTVAVTAGNRIVIGTGTSFQAAGAEAGDGLVLAGLIYEIETVDSDTQITLSDDYPGSTASGLAFKIVPTQSRNLTVVAKLNEILAAGAGSFTDGALAAPGVSFTDDPDTGLHRHAANALSLVGGGQALLQLVGNTASGAAVQSSATDTTVGRLLLNGAHGIGTQVPPLLADIDAAVKANGIHRTEGGAQGTQGTFPSTQKFGHLLVFGSGTAERTEVFANIVANELWFRRYRTSGGETGHQPWSNFWTSANAVPDTNGFLKQASPIVRLFNDRIEKPVEPLECTFARQSTGVYTLTGVASLATTEWQIEVPQDHNGNRLVFVATEHDESTNILTVSVSAPVFTGSVWMAGDPVDIPEGRWVDLRFAEEGEA